MAYCLSCNKEIKKGKKEKKFCNNQCQQDYNWNFRKKEIISTGKLYQKGTTQNRVGRRFLLESRGHICEICGRTEWLGQPIPLILDHIDGNSNNWDLNNVRLICGNCDMQQPTYKNKNKGNGRQYRRKRYRNGQSY